MKMRLISAQPDSDYFVWQVRVQLNNFKKFGIEKNAIVVFGYDMTNGINPNALRLVDETRATVLFFPDRRTPTLRKYVSTIRPHLLKTFFEDMYGELLYGYDIFYHDSDILFSSLPDFKAMAKKKKISMSDTISYVGAKYIISKSRDLFNEMCDIVGIDPELVENNEAKSGGAQYYIPKNMWLDYEFWDKVEKDSIALFDHMQKTAGKYNPAHPIQSWTADMWALLWNFWDHSYDTVVTKELAFSWPTYHINEWENYHIFHNSGVTPDRQDLFYKAKFINQSPFNDSHENVSDQFCSIKYVEEILETGKLLKK